MVIVCLSRTIIVPENLVRQGMGKTQSLYCYLISSMPMNKAEFTLVTSPCRMRITFYDWLNNLIIPHVPTITTTRRRHRMVK